VAACLLVAACNGESKQGSVPADGRPVELQGTVESPLGSMCFLEKVNHKSIRSRPVLKAGQAGLFEGWASVANQDEPAPRLVHVVLRPTGAAGARGKDVYLQMGRTPRPELANGDTKRELVGFEGETTLPAAGSYDVLVSQSDGHWQTICRTRMGLEIAR
jgi:hypothetical protein